MNTIASLLKPRSVAVIGASADPAKTSGRPVAYLQKHGFSGEIYPVNPRAQQIGGLQCYPDISSLPAAPDVGLILLGPEQATAAVQQLAERGTAAAIVLASGFAETGEAGISKQHALLDAAGNMRLLGPNTIGLVNLNDRIMLSASSALEIDQLLTGSIAVISQSGGILGSLLSRGVARGIGFSKLISTSNEADLELSDFIDYLVDDPGTEVIAVYMESIRNINKFVAAALRARAANKPVVIYKMGRSDSGAAAAAAHTGALAGTDAVYDALFQEVGVLRAQTFSDLLDLSVALASGRRLQGKRVAVLTSTGGAGSLISDNLGMVGLETPAPDLATATRLRSLDSSISAALDRNPIDVTLAGLQPDLLRSALMALVESPSYDAVVVVGGSSVLTHPTLMANVVRDCLPVSDKPILVYMSPYAPKVSELLTEYGIPVFSAPESCASVLSGLLEFHQWTPPIRMQAAMPPVEFGKLTPGLQNESEAKSLFTKFGIPVPREVVVRTADEAEQVAAGLGSKVVLKILSNSILHKTDVGGVAVGIPVSEIRDAVIDMTRRVQEKTGIRPEKFVIQEMIEGGVEAIVGVRKDALGMVLLLGMGGVAAELIKDTTLRILPPQGVLSREAALSMIKALKMYPLLAGYRGQTGVDIEALVDALIAFSNLAGQLGDQLETAEINPLFVLADGQGVKAADGVVVINAPLEDKAGSTDTMPADGYLL